MRIGNGSSTESFENQCGINAIRAFDRMVIFGLESDPYGHYYYNNLSCSFLGEKLPSNLKSKLSIKGEMDWKDIIDVMEIIMPEFKPDFRYNSLKRDTKGKIFFSSLNGIIALKFKNTNNLHWACFWKGVVVPLLPVTCSTHLFITDMEQMKVYVKNFDGFGHTIAFRTEDEVNILKRFNNCSKGYCQQCVRKDFCNQSDLKGSSVPIH